MHYIKVKYRVGFCPGGVLSGWGYVRVGFCPGGVMSGWGFVRVGFCPGGVLSGWDCVRVGLRPCEVGSDENCVWCLLGEMIFVSGFVRVWTSRGVEMM